MEHPPLKQKVASGWPPLSHLKTCTCRCPTYASPRSRRAALRRPPVHPRPEPARNPSQTPSDYHDGDAPPPSRKDVIPSQRTRTYSSNRLKGIGYVVHF